MLNFEYYNPTRIVFGKDQLNRLPELLKEFKAKRILIAYGQGSIVRSGLYQKIVDQLEGFHHVSFQGIEANPEFTTLIKARDLCRTESIDFVLAVGGGSVIDGVKFISGAVPYNGDPWEVLDKKEGCNFTEAIPFGTVLTLPATGSEANSGAVINRSEFEQKRVMGGPMFFPKFSFCDPTQVATLPKRQLANGIVDAYMHTVEQYLTYPSGNLLQERQAEAILATLIEIGPKVIENPSDYTLASNLMWCATHALNGNLRCGVPTDWATHMIGHELTAFYGIDHARTLAIIAPRLYEAMFNDKKEKLAQYGKRIWNLSGSEDEIALKAIEATEEFFQSLGIDTHISDYTENHAGVETRVREVFEERGWTAMGERQAIDPSKVEEIVAAAI
ncbi:MAG: iron-containing alcohol dehydrogenase [Crocinitomicaceae bacterium]|nr:iron-containing alcohol dehydrogenase [Crocinitomicaceae bacterium]